MNKKLTKIIGLFALLAFGLLLGGTLAYWRIEGSAATTLATGQLKGSLINEYQAESVLYPGGSLNQVISAKNSGDLDMLLRLKVDKMWDDSQLSDEKLHINYNSKYWMDGSDGYYYYKGILEPGEACEEPLCESISLDADASNEYSAKSGKIQATLECLQATSDAVSTWDKTYADLGVEEPKLRSAVPSTVTVTSDKKIEFSPSGEAAMPTFAGLTPGETCTQVVTLKNAYSEDVGFYLSVTGDGSLDKKAADMLSQYTTLTILDNTGKELYKGSAVDSAKAEFELGKAEKGKSNTVTVMLSLDPEMGNEYQKLSGNLQWKFVAQGEDIKEDGNGAVDDNQGKVASGTTGLPKTGDSYVMLIGVSLLLLLTIAAILYIYYRERKSTQTE